MVNSPLVAIDDGAAHPGSKARLPRTLTSRTLSRHEEDQDSAQQVVGQWGQWQTSWEDNGGSGRHLGRTMGAMADILGGQWEQWQTSWEDNGGSDRHLGRTMGAAADILGGNDIPLQEKSSLFLQSKARNVSPSPDL
uniref:Uncharacterized protein n=1 Tax=Timema genevievae TaxID=629358 RepID=A0A7R9JXQ1_TIMGE|nr:unnamed protein product [Timema genevievae]